MKWVEKALKRLPSLAKGFEPWFCEGNIFIDDIGLAKAGLINEMPELTVPKYFATAENLSQGLTEIFNLAHYDISIFPGNGAKKVYSSLRACGQSVTSMALTLSAKRVGFPCPSDVEMSNFVVWEAAKEIVVIDDVLATGMTFNKLIERGGLSQADLAVWFIQYPPADILLNNVRRIFSVYLLFGPDGRVPLNSLTTFCNDKIVLENYAKRYAKNERDFFNY